MLMINFKGFSFAFTVGVLIDGIFKFTRIFSGMTAGKSLTIREAGGHFEQKRRRSGFTPS